MRLKRLEIQAEFETGSMHLFHTVYPVYIDEPATVMNMDGAEFPAKVEYTMDKDGRIKIVIEPLGDTL